MIVRKELEELGFYKLEKRCGWVLKCGAMI